MVTPYLMSPISQSPFAYLLLFGRTFLSTYQVIEPVPPRSHLSQQHHTGNGSLCKLSLLCSSSHLLQMHTHLQSLIYTTVPFNPQVLFLLPPKCLWDSFIDFFSFLLKKNFSSMLRIEVRVSSHMLGTCSATKAHRDLTHPSLFISMVQLHDSHLYSYSLESNFLVYSLLPFFTQKPFLKNLHRQLSYIKTSLHLLFHL